MRAFLSSIKGGSALCKILLYLSCRSFLDRKSYHLLLSSIILVLRVLGFNCVLPLRFRRVASYILGKFLDSRPEFCYQGLVDWWV